MKIDIGHNDSFTCYVLQRSKSPKKYSNYESVLRSSDCADIYRLWQTKHKTSTRRYRILKQIYLYQETINNNGALELIYKLARTEVMTRAGG